MWCFQQKYFTSSARGNLDQWLYPEIFYNGLWNIVDQNLKKKCSSYLTLGFLFYCQLCMLVTLFSHYRMAHFKYLLFFDIFFVCMCVYVYTCCIHRAEERNRSHRTRDTDICEEPGKWWELNGGPLQEQQELSTSKILFFPLMYTLNIILFKLTYILSLLSEKQSTFYEKNLLKIKSLLEIDQYITLIKCFLFGSVCRN